MALASRAALAPILKESYGRRPADQTNREAGTMALFGSLGATIARVKAGRMALAARAAAPQPKPAMAASPAAARPSAPKPRSAKPQSFQRQATQKRRLNRARGRGPGGRVGALMAGGMRAAAMTGFKIGDAVRAQGGLKPRGPRDEAANSMRRQEMQSRARNVTRGQSYGSPNSGILMRAARRSVKRNYR